MSPLEEKIYDLIQPILGVTLIRMDENGPRPAIPYAAFKFKSARAVHHDHYSDVDDDGIQTVSGTREGTLSVQYYGGEPMAELALLRDKLRLTTILGGFMALGLVPYDTEAVTDISQAQETQVLKRANLDISLRYRSNLLDAVGVIEEVGITET